MGLVANLGEITVKDVVRSEIQITALVELKKARPWYKDIDSTVLQQNIKRLDKDE